MVIFSFCKDQFVGGQCEGLLSAKATLKDAVLFAGLLWDRDSRRTFGGLFAMGRFYGWGPTARTAVRQRACVIHSPKF